MADPVAITTETDPANVVRALKKRRSRSLHRALGILTVLPLIWVMLTGAALNHTVDWKLDRIQLSHPWILGAYGMVPTGVPNGLMAGSHEIVEWDGQIFLDTTPLEISGTLVGAVIDGIGVAVITDDEVLRLDKSGATVETLRGASLPETPLTGVAVHEGVTFLKTDAGWHEVGGDWLDFTRSAITPFTRQVLSPVENEETKSRLRSAWTRGGLPASRVILDLHAGRFLGPFARYFYDIVVVCTLWLCLTGVILFLRKPRHTR